MNQYGYGAQKTHEHLIVPKQNWENWRIKSLNSHPLQRYSLSLTNKAAQNIGSTNKKQNEIPKQRSNNATHQPVPKIIKINQHNYCVLLNNTLTLFTYLQESQRLNRKTKYSFLKTQISIHLPSEIEWVCGNGSKQIYIASKNQLLVIQIHGITQNGVKINQIFRKKIVNIKGLSFMISNVNRQLILVTQNSVQFYDMNKSYLLTKEYPISFTDQSSGFSDINKINGISIIVQSLNTFYFIGSAIQLKADVHAKLGRQNEKNQPIEKKCEVLYIAKFQIKKNQIQTKIFIIDHIFEIGIFKKSRVHQVGNETFVLSLYQQIIVIRRNFTKFMVWDNVTIAASKSNQKKGQLILADKRIMVYTQIGQIYAHQLFFNFNKAKLETPKIDSFKGNGNQEQILYDALIFEYEQHKFMKVLFYFKQNQIYIPNRKTGVNIQQNGQGGTKDSINFQIMCIQQSEPTQKLKQLLQKNKNPQQIQSFLKRFNIQQLKYKKSEWQVSSKGEKQIELLLLQIKDNQYIQSQLTKILQQKPHELQFLIAIEKKQKQRYRFMLASKLLRYGDDNQSLKKSTKTVALQIVSQIFLLRQFDQIKLAIQWLLQSKMFQHKLQYSMNFMSFKQYDFIQIGKLRSASLREEIKLLGVKGYQKRLKYFLNSFKYLVLDDFKQILRFVIGGLTVSQLKAFFIKNFPFILPSYVQAQGEDRCKLWDDNFQQDQSRIQTISLFRSQIKVQMIKILATIPPGFVVISLDKAMEIFDELFEEFMKGQWFILNSYKQHSLLRHSLIELKSSFEQLKCIGVFNTIIQFMYEQIQLQNQKNYNQQSVNDVINALKKQKYLTQKYIINIEARIVVYHFLCQKIRKNRKQYIDFTMLKKSKFIILKQDEYFDLLFNNFKLYITNQIKQIYEQKHKGLFIEKINQYLNSSLPNLAKLINFVDQFQDQQNQDVRYEVFQCICRLMQIIDTVNSKNLIQKLTNMPILVKDQYKFSVTQPIQQAKIAFAVYFANLFNKFNLKYKHSELIKQCGEETIQNTKIIKQLIHKYINEYNPQNQQIIIFQQNKIINEPITNIDLSQKIDFFSVTLYLHNLLYYKFKQKQLFKTILFQLFETRKFDEVRLFIDQINEFGKSFDDRVLIQDYPNYRLLNQFKHQHNIKYQLQINVFEWINCKYKQLANYKPTNDTMGSNQNSKQKMEKINQTFLAISSILAVLNSYNFNSQVQRQISKISLLQNIKNLSPDLLLQFLISLLTEQQKYGKISSFIFMINLLRKVSNPQIFNLQRRQQILQLLSCLNKIHKQFTVSYYSQNNRKNEQTLFGELCRFNAQFIVYLVDNKMPRVAGFVLLDLINSSYFYRDVLFYYVARMVDPTKINPKIVQKFIYQFMTIDNPHDLKKILNTFIVTNQLVATVDSKHYGTNVKTIFLEILKNNQLDQAFFFTIRNTQIQLSEFQQIAMSLNKYRNDQIITQSLLVVFVRTAKQRIEGQNNPTFMLFKRRLTTLLKPLERMEVIKDIYIIMNQLYIDQLKLKIQEKSKDKDKQSKNNNETLINQKIEMIAGAQNNYAKLKRHYEKYMQVQNLNPWLSINTEEIQPSAIRLQKLPQYSLSQARTVQTYINKPIALKDQQSKQIKDLRKKLFDNEQKLKQIQQANRQLLGQQIRPAITEVKLAIDKEKKEKLSLIERKKKKTEEEEINLIKEKTYKQDEMDQIQYDSSMSQDQIERLKAEEKQKLAEVKKNYTSKIVQQTENLILQLRERRKKVREETTVTFPSQQDKNQSGDQKSKSPSREGKRRSGLNIPIDSLYAQGADSMRQIKQDMRNSLLEQGSVGGSYYLKNQKKNIDTVKQEMKQRFALLKQTHLSATSKTSINKVLADKKGQFYVPRWQQKTPLRSKFAQLLEQKDNRSGKSSGFLEKAKKQLQTQAQLQKQVKQKEKEKQKNLTISQLIKKYKLLNEPHASQMLQKLQLVIKSPKASAEIIQSIYLQMRDIKNFIQLCNELLKISQLANEFIEYKSLKILQDSMKIKVPITFKQIFPANFFTTVHATALRDYYHIAYGIIKPSLIKLMQIPNTNVNALAMMIRYGFGSDGSFFYKIYEDSIRSLLDSYEAKNQLVFTEIQLMQLAEKLRVNYNNLSPTNRKIKFQQLIQQVRSNEKRKKLIQALLQNLQSKSSVVNKQGYQQFRLILVKLQGLQQ